MRWFLVAGTSILFCGLRWDGSWLLVPLYCLVIWDNIALGCWYLYTVLWSEMRWFLVAGTSKLFSGLRWVGSWLLVPLNCFVVWGEMVHGCWYLYTVLWSEVRWFLVVNCGADPRQNLSSSHSHQSATTILHICIMNNNMNKYLISKNDIKLHTGKLNKW